MKKITLFLAISIYASIQASSSPDQRYSRSTPKQAAHSAIVKPVVEQGLHLRHVHPDLAQHSLFEFGHSGSLQGLEHNGCQEILMDIARLRSLWATQDSEVQHPDDEREKLRASLSFVIGAYDALAVQNRQLAVQNDELTQKNRALGVQNDAQRSENDALKVLSADRLALNQEFAVLKERNGDYQQIIAALQAQLMHDQNEAARRKAFEEQVRSDLRAEIERLQSKIAFDQKSLFAQYPDNSQRKFVIRAQIAYLQHQLAEAERILRECQQPTV